MLVLPGGKPERGACKKNDFLQSGFKSTRAEACLDCSTPDIMKFEANHLKV